MEKGLEKNRTRQLKIALFVLMLFTLYDYRLDAGSEPVIEIDPLKTSGEVNPLIFGNNMIGYDPATFEDRKDPYYGYSNYGAGVWNPVTKDVNPDVAALAKEAGLTIARFPGGCGSHNYNWKNTIGPVEKRPKFQYGLDEFMRTCETIGCEVVITVSYYAGSSADAADIVEYLNSPNDGSNPGGGIDWAKRRADNGHPRPYNVEYFEFGNEEYHGNHREIRKVSGAEYGRKFIEYARAMKSIDQCIKLGAVTVNPAQTYYSGWNVKVFDIAGPYIDFLIEHTYHDYESGHTFGKKDPGTEKINDFFKDVLDNLYTVGSYYKELGKKFKETTGRKNIPIAITEYNGAFIQLEPIPYRHSLGTALFNAGLIQIFMRPENNILMANYWQFVNSYWGMVRNDSFMQGVGTYSKRPNFYVFKLFKEHFGKKLLRYRSTSSDLIVSASLSEDGRKIYLMVINKDMKRDSGARVIIKNSILSKKAYLWTLNGPSVDSTNETGENVKIETSETQLKSGELNLTFQPHSLTSIEFTRN